MTVVKMFLHLSLTVYSFGIMVSMLKFYLFLVLGAVWYDAIINSQEELNTVANVVKSSSTCLGLASIGGSTNLNQFTQFAFSNEYIPNTSGKSYKSPEVYFSRYWGMIHLKNET